jgi:hypothetical protein
MDTTRSKAQRSLGVNKDIENLTEGCGLMLETIEAQKETIGGLLGAVQDLEKVAGNLIATCQTQHERIENLSTRIDIVNKRLRRIEEFTPVRLQ